MRHLFDRVGRVLGLFVQLAFTHPARWQGIVDRWRSKNDPFH